MGTILTYRVVRITELMAYEFGQVEGDINRLEKRDVSNLPVGYSFEKLVDKLKTGELALLTDFPSKPVLSHDRMTRTWSLTSDASELLTDSAKSAFSTRANMGGGPAVSTSSAAGYSYVPNIDETYVPEPVVNVKQSEPELKFEYCFEIFGTEESFRSNVGYWFSLAKTKAEISRGRWGAVRTEHGMKYTTQTAVDEPKRLLASVGDRVLGISLPYEVQVKPIGSGQVKDSFIPITPTVQLGERLAFPSEGYFYHFANGRLVQEYKMLGDGHFGFYATRTTQDRLDDEQLANLYQNTILVYWKIDGQMVTDQILVYLEHQITKEQLDNINDEWVNENGKVLDVNELLSAPALPVDERHSDTPNENPTPSQATHTVAINPITNSRELWSEIAEQHNLYAKQLLDLNPEFNDDPMKLKVGDVLKVSVPPAPVKRDKKTELPPASPGTYNCASNVFYRHTDPLISGTSCHSINQERLLEKDYPVVNVKTLSKDSKATDYGKTAILALPASAGASNLGLISTSTSNTMGSWSISGEAVGAFARVGGFLLAALWPSQLADSTLDAHPEYHAHDTGQMRVRFNMYTDENGKQQIVGIKTGDGAAYGDRVSKRAAEKSGQNFVAELDNGITLTWTPDGSTDVLSPDTVTTENNELDVQNILVRPIEEHEQELGTALYPEDDLAEYIITFPIDTGLSPLYIVFRKTARDESGVVTGNGEDISGTWLESAGEDLGAPIPKQIADKLRGQEFNSFDAFRKAFWLEVSKDPILSRQFIAPNIKRMKDGKAPRARFKDTVGGRRSFELHHIEEIQHGGDVYNVDNMRVNTPRNHINIHKG